MKATAIAPANIALIKYWGKKDEELRLPLNSSISMNLSNCLTTTTVEFSPAYKKDTFFLSDNSKSDKEKNRVFKHLDRIRKLTKISLKAKVVTKNNFPSSSGIASSASGFAALTVAACAAAGLQLPELFYNFSARALKLSKTITEKELTILARIGSGSACRSIPDGFVEWSTGDTSENSYAYSLYPETYWDLRDIILIVSNTEKKIGSSKGMESVWSSPLMQERLKTEDVRLKKMKNALQGKDFSLLGETMEADCLSMHAVMQTQNPPLFYWTKETLEIIKVVYKKRESGLPVFFTIDAGPNVHLFCEGKLEKEVVNKFKSLKGVKSLIINKLAVGARLSEKELF